MTFYIELDGHTRESSSYYFFLSKSFRTKTFIVEKNTEPKFYVK